MKPQALIIDDNRLNIEVLEMLLDIEGFESQGLEDARTLASALDSLPNLKVIFLDLDLPGEDGFQICEKIQHWHEYDTIPIVAYTVYRSQANRVMETGFHSFLSKPLKPRHFPEQLDRILHDIPVWEVN